MAGLAMTGGGIWGFRGFGGHGNRVKEFQEGGDGVDSDINYSYYNQTVPDPKGALTVRNEKNLTELFIIKFSQQNDSEKWEPPYEFVIEYPMKNISYNEPLHPVKGLSLSFSLQSDRQAHLSVNKQGEIGFTKSITPWSRFYPIKRKKPGVHKSTSNNKLKNIFGGGSNSKKDEKPDGKYQYQFLNYGNYKQPMKDQKHWYYLAVVDGKIATVEKDKMEEHPDDATWFDVVVIGKIDPYAAQKAALSNRPPPGQSQNKPTVEEMEEMNLQAAMKASLNEK